MQKSRGPKKPINWFPILIVAVPLLWGLSIWLRDSALAFIALAMSVYLVLDAREFIHRKRAARADSKAVKPRGRQ